MDNSIEYNRGWIFCLLHRLNCAHNLDDHSHCRCLHHGRNSVSILNEYLSDSLIDPLKMNIFPIWFSALVIERCTGITELTGFYPVEAMANRVDHSYKSHSFHGLRNLVFIIVINSYLDHLTFLDFACKIFSITDAQTSVYGFFCRLTKYLVRKWVLVGIHWSGSCGLYIY